KKLVKLGHELIELHLMRSIGPDEPGYPVAGNNRVDLVKYEDERVYINSEQYFKDIPADVWEYHIGGYQVAHKWLKDRRGRLLTFDELQHYSERLAVPP
ncbi:MAG TPA: type ISP restriction/modification enzyme, partial [Casimicrobiaceae bacterium]